MVGLPQIAWVFIKIGVIFFGGGYVLIPVLHRLMVDQLQWLSLKEFLDGVALSQLTPGPLAMLATFSGFKAGGAAGALVATACIFLPCTAFMLFLSSRYKRLRKMDAMIETLEGMLPAVVGLVAAAAYTLGKTSLATPRDFLLLGIGYALLQFTTVSPMVVILGAGLLGYFLHF